MLRLSNLQHIEISTTQTRQLRCTFAWLDLPRNEESRGLLSQLGETNVVSLSSPSTATAVPRPVVPGTVRNFDLANIYNLSAVTSQVSLIFNNNGTSIPLKEANLEPGETLFWSPQAGYGLL